MNSRSILSILFLFISVFVFILFNTVNPVSDKLIWYLGNYNWVQEKNANEYCQNRDLGEMVSIDYPNIKHPNWFEIVCKDNVNSYLVLYTTSKRYTIYTSSLQEMKDE